MDLFIDLYSSMLVGWFTGTMISTAARKSGGVFTAIYCAATI